MDARAQQRLYVLNHVLTGGLTAEDAALVLRLSIRQVRRLLRRYRVDGSAGLVHGNRGRVPGHRIPDTIRDRLVELATTTYAGVNHTHLAELLAERRRPMPDNFGHASCREPPRGLQTSTSRRRPVPPHQTSDQAGRPDRCVEAVRPVGRRQRLVSEATESETFVRRNGA